MVGELPCSGGWRPPLTPPVSPPHHTAHPPWGDRGWWSPCCVAWSFPPLLRNRRQCLCSPRPRRCRPSARLGKEGWGSRRREHAAVAVHGWMVVATWRRACCGRARSRWRRRRRCHRVCGPSRLTAAPRRRRRSSVGEEDGEGRVPPTRVWRPEAWTPPPTGGRRCTPPGRHREGRRRQVASTRAGEDRVCTGHRPPPCSARYPTPLHPTCRRPPTTRGCGGPTAFCSLATTPFAGKPRTCTP